MDALVSVTAKVSEYTVAPIGRQVGYLISYEDNFKELVDHVKVLEGARDGVKHSVESERRNGKEIETAVHNWLDRVDGVIQQANQLQEDPRRAKVSCFNLMLRHQLSRKAKKLAKDVVEVQGKRKFDRVGYLPALDGAISVSATRGREKNDTRKSIKEDLGQALRDPKVSRVGVYGLGGVGKTTLVKEVVQKAMDDKLFHAVVMANVSQTPDLGRIQGEIADLLGLRFDEETIFGRACRLCERIKKEETILIILDDIWTRLDLEKVGIPFGEKHNGCKMLMTSRNQDVLREMESQKNFRLEVLSEEETWSLFKVMAGDVDKEPNLQQIAFEVAKKCAGLPVVIVTVARALKNQDIHAWKYALNQLARIDNKELHEITYSGLELSYCHLEGSEMKALFLLCATIGEWPWISDLLKYGMGLGIFKHVNSMEEARNRLYKMISALKASCLLQEADTSVEILKMHNVVRDVAISLASRDQNIFMVKEDAKLKEWPTDELLKRCPQIFLHWWDISELPERLDCPELKLFLLNSSKRSLKISDSFFESMKSLRALGLGDMDIDSLPTSFHSLTSIHTLGLYRCTLGDMAAIGALKNLEILTLKNSSMATLPIEIRQLNRLRLLDLSSSGIEFFPPNIIASLTQLEELYLGNTSIDWETENSNKQNKNASLAELRHLSNLTALELQIREAWILPRDLMFEKLERYKIVIGDVWEWSDIEDGTLKTLKLKLRTNIHLEHGIKALIKKVENLYLDEVDGIWNVLYQLNGVGFPLLKNLYIQNHAKIKHIIDSMERNQAQVSFPNLKVLVLHNLNNLEKICHGPLANDSFSQLKVIKVQKCNHLKYLLSFSMVKGLFHLSKIDISNCNSMKMMLFLDSEPNEDKIELFSLRYLTLQHLQALDQFCSNQLTSSITEQKFQQCAAYIPMPFFSAKVAFSNLETLKLSAINLNKIWDNNELFVHKLANLIVEDCGGLRYLFTSTMLGSFPNLERLEISRCRMMEEIIATEEGNNNAASEKEDRFSMLETIILKDMENLKTIWHYQFERLKTLEIQNCEKIVLVFPSSMQRTYNNLEKLVVVDCASVEEIFKLTSNDMSSKEDTTQLRKLTLDGLPKVKQIWSRDPKGILSFHNLQDVCLEYCEKLEYLFPLSVATSCLHLKELIIKWCGMEEIVAKKEDSMCTTAMFDFQELNSLELWQLDKLQRFYAGNHTLLCPSLKVIDVSNCAKLNLFKTLSASDQGNTPADGKLHVSMQQPLFVIEEVIPNLEVLTLNNKDATMIMQGQFSRALFAHLKCLKLSRYENEESILLNWYLQNLSSLEWLVVEWSSSKEIFRDGGFVCEEVCTRLKKLTLHQLPELQHICKEGSQIDPVLKFLEYLYVDTCSSMIYLVPSSVTFSHMTYLEIANCNSLVNLISYYTARSLVNLTTLKIKECNSLEEIMAEEGDETIYDIAFTSLEILVMQRLPKLYRFCSKFFLRFPLLKEVVVSQCHHMKIFSEGNINTPKLRKVRIAENDEEWLWKGNLNATIKSMFEDKTS